MLPAFPSRPYWSGKDPGILVDKAFDAGAQVLLISCLDPQLILLISSTPSARS